MSTRTPTIGLKKPEGSDPFLTQDFADNYDLIDAAFAARPAGGTTTTSHTHSEYAPLSHTHGTGGTTSAVNGFASFTTEFTTSTTGFATVNIAPGFKPKALIPVVVAPLGGQINLPMAVTVDEASITATSVTCRIFFWRSDTNQLDGNNQMTLRVRWLALA